MATNDLDRNHLRRQSPSPPLPSSSSRCSSLSPPPSKIPRLTPQALATEALGELEFRKQFLILNYFAGNEFDKVTSAEEIRSFKDLPMAQFEEQLWERYGRRFVDEEDRVTLLKHFTPSEPWVPKPSTGKVDESKMPHNLSDEQLEDELIGLFLKTRFQPSYAKSDAAGSWLAQMDRFLTLGDDKVEEKNAAKEKLIKLIDINHEALDAPKKGVTIKVPGVLRPKEFPRYMERKNSFKSDSILGKIYDQVKAYVKEDLSKKEIRKLPCFDVDVPENCWKSWKENYDIYRTEMSKALSNKDSNVKNKAADKIITKYKKLLYGAKELEETTKKMDDIYNRLSPYII